MTLRHYGRALAAASGAVLLCATLSVPASRAPTPTETRCTKVT